MTFWQENYPFIKDVYVMRQTKMIEWIENVEKAISRIMADKVYTSSEFKRERDNFHVRQIQSPKNGILESLTMCCLGSLQRSGEEGGQGVAPEDHRDPDGREGKGGAIRTD